MSILFFKNKKVIILGVLLMLIGCKSNTGVKSSSQLTAVNSDMETITVKVNGNGSSILNTKNDAILSSFNALMFQGIPSTSFNKPLIDNEVESKKNNKKF